MWRCPYCFAEMLTRSRSGHLKNKQGCSQQHALHLAEEAKKKEEVLCFDNAICFSLAIWFALRDPPREVARYFSRRFALLLLICFPLFPFLQKPTSKDTKQKKRLQTKKQQLLRASGLRMVVVHQKLVLASPAIEFFAALRAAFPFPCYK